MINYTIDERVLVYPLRDPSIDVNKDNETIKYFVKAIDKLTMLFSSSKNSIFLSRKAIANLNMSKWTVREYELSEMVSREDNSSVGRGHNDFRMSYRELDTIIRNDPKLNYVSTKDYLNRYKNMLHFNKDADNPTKPWRNRKFKTLSFEDQFFYSNITDENIKTIADYESFVENKKKNYDYEDNSDVDSLKLKYPYRDIPIDDKIKLLSYLNDKIYPDSEKHFIITNGDSDCSIDQVKKIAEDDLLKNPIKFKGIRSQSIKKEPVIATSFFNAYTKAKDSFASAEDSVLLFGEDLENEVSIKKDSWLKRKGGSFACPPDRIYYYLQTLNDVVVYKKNNPTMPIDEIARYLGCNCSSESIGMENCDFLMNKRKWSIGKKKEIFTYHLKPSTRCNEDDDNEDTIRIYFKWNRKKHGKQAKDGIVIGMILTHPKPCPILQDCGMFTHKIWEFKQQGKTVVDAISETENYFKNNVNRFKTMDFMQTHKYEAIRMYKQNMHGCPYTNKLIKNADGSIECKEYARIT